MILDNRQFTIREVADDVGTSFGSWKAIFTDVLGMNRSAAKIVQKQRSMDFIQRRSRFG